MSLTTCNSAASKWSSSCDGEHQYWFGLLSFKTNENLTLRLIMRLQPSLDKKIRRQDHRFASIRNQIRATGLSSELLPAFGSYVSCGPPKGMSTDRQLRHPRVCPSPYLTGTAGKSKSWQIVGMCDPCHHCQLEDLFVYYGRSGVLRCNRPGPQRTRRTRRPHQRPSV